MYDSDVGAVAGEGGEACKLYSVSKLIRVSHCGIASGSMKVTTLDGDRGSVKGSSA
jgi:hypothetical protein